MSGCGICGTHDGCKCPPSDAQQVAIEKLGAPLRMPRTIEDAVAIHDEIDRLRTALAGVRTQLGDAISKEHGPVEEQRSSRSRPEASLHQPAGELRKHDRGGNPRTGLPRGRSKAGKGRMPGTNGSWPATNEAPKPPAFLALYDDIAEDLPMPVFGQYPRGLIAKLLPWLRCQRKSLVHVCSGSLPPGEGVRVDIRPDAKPDILADGRALPFADGSIPAVLLDPPYTEQYAKDLYGIDYPRPSHLLREAARVVRPCGRIGFVHYLVPMPPPGCRLVKVMGLSTGLGFSMRAVTIYEREQGSLFDV